MKHRYRMFRRAGVFYVHNNETGKQESLRTKDEAEAEQLLHAKNHSSSSPHLNLAMAKVYLTAHDPRLVQRTWNDVMKQYSARGKESTRERNERGWRSTAFDPIRNKPLLETTSEDLLAVMAEKGAFTNHCLRRLHNLALGLGWLLAPVLTPKLWPKIQPQAKRGITLDEHCRIIAAEGNLERRLYYEMLWETGAAQSDAAQFSRANINGKARTLKYSRVKTGHTACLRIGKKLQKLIARLPKEGLFFPRIAVESNKDRAAEFRRRCRILKLNGVSLHSYRYAWAERAMACAYPERWAQSALGHNSRAVHQAYAKGAHVTCPPLEEFEHKIIRLPEGATQGANVAERSAV